MASDRPKPGRKARQPARKAKLREPAETASFPVVGIGASAGGLEAFTKLLQNLPANTGMAFVLIQHLDPTHESILASLLSRSSSMPVHEAVHNMRVQPNRVYVIPPKTTLTLDHSTLHLAGRVESREQHLPVDQFFQSLARSRRHRAIGIILSGTASDGTAGLREIKAEGGITFAQEPGSAKFDGMPRSAISSGVVDFILRPQDIARELERISRHPYIAAAPDDSSPLLLNHGKQGKDDLNKIFRLLRAHTGSDFSSYKRGTIERRLRRRMALKRTESIPEYLRVLQEDRDEVKALYEDFLISVTEFFRDPDAFDALKQKVFPELLRNQASDTPIRVWVAGCATGEEAYSIAMLLLDFLTGQEARNPVLVFGTDISEVAVAKARAGFYPESAVNKIPPDYFRRFFTKAEHGCRISKRIREMCVFARQDIGKDPPFSKLDLISCRNVLIYLGQELQNRVLPMFHYALKARGCLLLGNSETVGTSGLFSVLDKTHKIYVKVPEGDHPPVDLPLYRAMTDPPAPDREEPVAEYDLQRESDRVVLARYGPAGVVVNEKLEIIQFRGDMSPYLRPAVGPASLNFLKMLREEIATDVNAAVDLAKRGADPVRREGLRIGGGDHRPRNLNIEVVPIPAPPERERLLLVLFEQMETPPETAAGDGASAETGRLEGELAVSRRHLQFLMDERQATEEELRSANEEILSSNEELQSTNEELETSQEELQSANEELTTVNDELQHRNTELAELSNDLSNLINSVNIPIVMLGNDLRIRRFTPMAGRVLNLRPSDVNRPFTDIKSTLEFPDLVKLISEVMVDLTPRELEVRDRNGAWFALRIRPYRTDDHKIDGAVMVLYDVDQLKRSLQEVQQAGDFARAIVETVPGPLVILDSDAQVMIANRAFYKTFQLGREETEGHPLAELAGGQWNIATLNARLRRTLERSRSFENFEMEADFQRIGHRIFSVEGRRIDLGPDRRRILLVSQTDVTTQRLAEREMHTTQSTLEKSLKHAESSLRESEADLRQNRSELRALAARLLTTQEEERRRVSRELHDDLNQKLAMLEVDADRLGQQLTSSPEVLEKVRSLRARVAEVSNDVRRVAYQLHPSILDHLGLAVALRSYCSEFSGREGIKVRFSAEDAPELVPEALALCLYRVTQESLRNVAKHAAAKSASVKLEKTGDRIHLCIRDNGAGFEAGSGPHKGGIGLLSMKERVRLVDGEFTLKSKPGRGTRIDVWAPLQKKKS